MNTRLGILIITLFSMAMFSAKADNTTAKIKYFDLPSVELLPSPFKVAQDNNIRYHLELDADKLLAPFLREAGLPAKAESYTNWEDSGLDGHIGGHYISGLALLYGSTGNQQIKERLDYVLSELERCQEAYGDGYIGGVPKSKEIWDEIASGNIRAPHNFSLNDRWVPLYNIHKTYAGLRDAWLYAKSDKAKKMLIAMTDWMANIVSNLDDEQIQYMLNSEHGGLNETFADVAAITGDKKYLELAKKFSHRAILDPLIENKDELTGIHANTQIPKVLGYKRVADLDANDKWNDAVEFFWNNVTGKRTVVIGGNSVSEHFNDINDYSRMISHIEGPETCNTYNMLRLTRMLYQTDPKSDYMDFYERGLYNHILSTQHPEQGGFVYFTQMRPGHYRVYSQPHTSFWCCVGSGLENHSKYGESIYAHTDNTLYVNLFIPSVLNWDEMKVSIRQENNIPDEDKTTLTINTKKKKHFSIKLRVPFWTAHGNVAVKVNGETITAPIDDGYITVERKWKDGDKLEMSLPMTIRAEQLPDKSNYFAFCYGPVVLAADLGKDDLKGLFADDSRGGHIAHGKQIPLREMPIVISKPDEMAEKVSLISKSPLKLKLSGLYPEEYSDGLELTPFYRLHESRYAIYWAQATEQELENMQSAQAKAEEAEIALNSITVDRVACGEQQPESDHFVKAENSWIGYSEDEHWRESDKWFSYQMRNGDKTAKTVMLKYLMPGSWEKRKFNLYANDTLIKEFVLDKGKENEIVTEQISIPSNESSNSEIVLKIEAADQSRTAKIIEVRLLNE